MACTQVTQPYASTHKESQHSVTCMRPDLKNRRPVALIILAAHAQEATGLLCHDSMYNTTKRAAPASAEQHSVHPGQYVQPICTALRLAIHPETDSIITALLHSCQNTNSPNHSCTSHRSCKTYTQPSQAPCPPPANSPSNTPAPSYCFAACQTAALNRTIQQRMTALQSCAV